MSSRDHYETWKQQTKDAIFAAAVVQLSIRYSCLPANGYPRQHRQPWPMGDAMKEITEKAAALAEAWEATTAL